MGNRKTDAADRAAGKDAYAHKLYLSDFLREPVIRAALEALQFSPGSRGLDAGCGIGSHTMLLAEAVAPGGHVTGLDLSPDLLARARETAMGHSLSRHVSFREGDLNRLPFEDDTFDWVWSVDCAGYPARGSVSLIRELARVVRPGGIVAILGWSSQRLLPGYPLLEARLNTISPWIAPLIEGKRPEQHFLRALSWFRAAGLTEPSAQTLAGDVHAPLSAKVREALASLFEMFWGEARSDMSPEDRAEYRRLCQPGSPHFLPDLSDYYAFFTYSLFHGRVVK